MATISLTRSDSQSKLADLQIFKQSSRHMLTLVSSKSNNFLLYHCKKKQIKIEEYRVFLQKSKLVNNLEIYEWRHKTQFPIVKIRSISIKQSLKTSPSLILVSVLTQHCPVRLSDLNTININQTLYLLKESMIGFERLFNKFGGFLITQRMVGINQKGHCKVWLNENFSLNASPSPNIPQKTMVMAVMNIINSHSSQSKNHKKLFLQLKNCYTFLSSIKAIEEFIRKMKILIPTRFIQNQNLKQISKFSTQFLEKFRLSKKLSERSEHIGVRFSIKSGISKIDNQNVVFKSPQRNNSPIQIKRFKSEHRFTAKKSMKASDGQTAYSQNNRQIKTSKEFSLATPNSFNCTPNNPESLHGQSCYQRRWAQDSSFIMGNEQVQKDKSRQKQKEKKQLSHSQAFQTCLTPLKKDAERKYSINNNLTSFKSPMKDKKIEKKPKNFFTQFTNIFNDDYLIESPKIITEQNEEETVRFEHLQKIMRNNGWDNMSGFLNKQENELKQSFHAKDEQKPIPSNLYDVKLSKLGSMGRRQVAMSILPQQFEDNV